MLSSKRAIIRYIKVGRLLHLIAILDVILLVSAITALTYDDLTILEKITLLVVAVMFSIQFVTAELDGYSRFQNYKQLKDQLYFNGYQDRILRPMIKSRCQRDAALVACRELGLENEARDYYHRLGYKWYHVPPDFVFEHPLFFFSKYFWNTTFFVPYYEPKVDYNKVDLVEFTLRNQRLKLAKAA